MSAQMYDKIVVDGREHWLAATPLEVYFKRYPEKRPVFKSFNSGCMRGYVALWEVRGDMLYLTGVQMINETDSSFASIFPDVDDGVFAEWVSGELRCTSGKLIKADNAGFASTREFERLLSIESGIVLSSR